MPGTQRNAPGGCCCCPDCTAPVPVATGSLAANSPWYLTASPHTDKASFHTIALAGANIGSIIGYSPFPPWYKMRSYFAYKDAGNHAFAEFWGIRTGSAFNYYYTFYSRVCEVTDGTETEIASHTLPPVHYSVGTVQAGISVTYDESKNIVRVVCWFSGGTNYDKFRSYDYLSLTQTPEKGVRYGWGAGAMAGTVTSNPIALLANLRHIDYCQSFPYVTWSGGLTAALKHPWYKSTMPETATLAVSGVTCDGGDGYYDTTDCDNCAALNDTFSLSRIAVDQLYNVANEATVLHASGTDALSSEEIDAGCVDVGAGGWNWKIHFKLRTGISDVTLIAIAYGYIPTTGKYWWPMPLAYATAGFAHGRCWGYDGANAIDGLVFSQWTNYGVGGAPVVIRTSGGAVALTFPDFRGATATVSLP